MIKSRRDGSSFRHYVSRFLVKNHEMMRWVPENIMWVMMSR